MGTSETACRATKRDGTPCRAIPTASGYCFAHDPELQAKTAGARKAGGSNSSNADRVAKRVPKDMRDLAACLLLAVDEVHRGDLSPRAASAMASLAGAAVRVYEVGSLEARIEALESRVSGQTAQRRSSV